MQSGIPIAMGGTDTEGRLRDWRYGQAQAERLTAALLHLEGYQDIEPQHPLGGPDGLKDVVCCKDGIPWVAAAYFPPTPPSEAEIRNKFDNDALGVEKSAAKGFAFFVNQNLTIAERQALIERSPATRTEIYHLERMISLLNAPKGCGLRLEYLRIPMTEEEQWAFWSSMNSDIVRRLADNELRQDARLQQINDRLDLLVRTIATTIDLTSQPSSIKTTPGPEENPDMPTSILSATMLCWLHRIVTENSGPAEPLRGRFRSVQVWLGAPGSTLANADYVPPTPEQVPNLVADFLEWWHHKHVELKGKSKPEIAMGLADFHHRFLSIHPFLDANGRVARLLLDEAARELLNQGIGEEFITPPKEYYLTIQQAHEGDLQPLCDRIIAALK